MRQLGKRGLKKAKTMRPKKGRTKTWLQEFFKDAPKGKVRRFIWWMHPRRQYKFWFSKNGAIFGAKMAVLGFAALLLLFGLLYAYYARELPDPSEIGYLNQATKFYDRTGEHLLYSIYGDENRTVVEFDKISEHAKHSTVAIEDKNFYHHIGLSPTGIVRAGFNNLRGKRTQGGSTITQQFVKNALLTNERSFERKIKEAILALELERLYSKDEILGFYLNEIPYGGTAYGIESAAHSFFNKPASDLTIDESAMLAALPQAPTYYSPYGERTGELIGRTHYIIDLMEEQGYITEEEATAAKGTDFLAKINQDFTPYRNIKAPYLVLEAQRRLEELYGAQTVATAGWKVITTVDLDLQAKAEKAIADNIPLLDRAGANNAAIVATDPNSGQVLAAAGRDFNNPEFGRYNIPFTAMRQPGSSVKPYTYATLMKGNYGGASVFYDLKTDFGGNYTPGNADDRYKGALTMREALAQSRNIPAVKALYIAGLENVFQTWREVGLVSSDLDPARHGLSFGLGSAEVKLAEHVNGYETFASGGVHHDQALWLKITNPQGQIVDEWRDTGGKRVFDEQIAFIINDILSDEGARAALFGRTARFLTVDGVEIAAKTGTTNARRDAWLLGYSTCVASGLWVGHTQNETLDVITPSLVGPIWHQFMVDAHVGKTCAEFKRPGGLKEVTLDRYSGRLPDDATGGSRVTDIFPAWYNPPASGGTEKFTLDIVSGKLATDCTPPGARRETAVGGVDAEIPPTDPSYSRWSAPVRAYAASIGRVGGVSGKPTANDDVHHCIPPKIAFTVTDHGGGNYTFTAEIQRGEFPGKQMDFKVNGNIVGGGAISGTGNCGENCYTWNGNPGAGKATAVFTDEGYYQITSDEKDVLGSSTGPFSITDPTPNEDVGDPGAMTTTNMSWTGGSPNFTVHVNGVLQPQCSGSARSCTINVPPGNSFTATVTDANGPSASKSVTFKK